MSTPIQPTIDTSNLLTILGIVAAVWAVISPTAKLSFRLCMTRRDWLVIWVIVGAVHVLIYEEVLRSLGVYPDLGQWRWGMDKNGAIYLLFLTLTGYIFWRSRTFRLSPRKLPLFEQLTTSLLRSRKFAEVGELLDQHLIELIASTRVTIYRSSLTKYVAPMVEKGMRALSQKIIDRSNKISQFPLNIAHKFLEFLDKEIRVVQASESSKGVILKQIFSSRDLVDFLALAHPYLCLQAMRHSSYLVKDFQDRYFQALLANASSVFFIEIRNSQSNSDGHRLYLPEENRLLNFYCEDVRVAEKLGVYSSVGDAILIRIESDEVLASSLNKPLLRYIDNDKFNCPIFCGIYFFRIMVLEGLYQRMADHLWLQYVTHIAERIIKAMRLLEPDDENLEFATPFSYLLYYVVEVTCVWIEDALVVTDSISPISQAQIGGKHAYISFQASAALGGVIQSALSAEKLPDRLKVELLECVLYMIRRLTYQAHLEPLIRSVVAHLVNPYGMGLNRKHIEALAYIYGKQDPVLKDATQVFGRVLEDARCALAAADMRQQAT